MIKKIHFNFTDCCNYHCFYCINSSGNSPIIPIDVDKIVRFFDESGYSWIIELSGGEPFVIPNFIELCQKLTLKHKIIILTNFQ